MWGFLSKAVTVIGKVVFSVGRVLSQAGSTLFNVQNAVNFVTKTINHPYSIVIAIPAIFANVFINAVTRVPTIWRKFGQINPPRQIIEEEQEPEKKSCCPKNCCSCDPELNAKGRFIYYSLSTTGMMSGVFSSSKSYLDGIVLCEFIATALAASPYKHDDPDNAWKNWVMNGAAFLLALSNFISYYYYNLNTIKRNAKTYAKNWQDGNVHFDRYAAYTLASASFNVLSAPALGYFSMDRAMAKMPLIQNLPPQMRKTIAGLSSFTNLTSTLTSSVSQLYNSMSGNLKHNYERGTYDWEYPLKANTYAWGSIDCVIGSFGNFIAVMYTMHEIAGTDLYNPYVMGFAAACGLSKAILDFVFSVHKGYHDMMQDTHDLAQKEMQAKVIEKGYQIIPDANLVVPANTSVQVVDDDIAPIATTPLAITQTSLKITRGSSSYNPTLFFNADFEKGSINAEASKSLPVNWDEIDSSNNKGINPMVDV